MASIETDRALVQDGLRVTQLLPSIVIGHARTGTYGKPKNENTHPFRFRSWMFAHHGSIPAFERHKGVYQPARFDRSKPSETVRRPAMLLERKPRPKDPEPELKPAPKLDRRCRRRPRRRRL